VDAWGRIQGRHLVDARQHSLTERRLLLRTSCSASDAARTLAGFNNLAHEAAECAIPVKQRWERHHGVLRVPTLCPRPPLPPGSNAPELQKLAFMYLAPALDERFAPRIPRGKAARKLGLLHPSTKG
jgi:hypothetical protein